MPWVKISGAARPADERQNAGGILIVLHTDDGSSPVSSFVLASQSLPGIRLVLAQNNNGESQIMKLRSALANHAKVVAR